MLPITSDVLVQKPIGFDRVSVIYDKQLNWPGNSNNNFRQTGRTNKCFFSPGEKLFL